jgi:hypothetical protein
MIAFRVVVTAAVIACASSVALAEDPQAAADRAALSEALFQKGKALMAEHRYAEACPAFAESLRIDSGGGTQLALALCLERQGRTASAWAEFKVALARALQDGEHDRATVARQHADALEPRLSRLVVRIDPATAAIPGLSVRRDGIALGRPAWDLPAPLDPGDHDIEVTAPGRPSWTTLVNVGPDGAMVTVVVPPLGPPLPDNSARDVQAPLAVIAPPVVTAPPPATGPSPRTVAAASLAGIGVVSLGIGIGFGVLALTKQSFANSVCPSTLCNDPSALQANSAARMGAWVADVAIPLGVASGIASVVLFATAPKRNAPASGMWTFTVSPARPIVSVTTTF